MVALNRSRFDTEEEYHQYLRNEQAYIDKRCYSHDPLTQFLNRKAYYELERQAERERDQ